MINIYKTILLFFILLLPQFSLEYLGNTKFFFGIVSVLYIVSVLLSKIISKKSGGRSSFWSFLPYILFLIICALSLLWTQHSSEKDQMLFRIFTLLSFSICFYLLFDNKPDISKFQSYYFAGVVFASLQIIIIYFLAPELFLGYPRANIAGIDANESSFILSAGLIFGLSLYNKKANLLLVFSLFIVIAAVMLTMSRSGVIALITIFVVFILAGHLQRKQKYLFILLIIFLSPFAVIYDPDLTRAVFSRSFAFFDKIGALDLSGRNITWEYSLKIFFVSNNQLLGFGYESFANELETILWRANAHNVFIKVLFELGYVGLTVLLIMLVVSMANIYKNWKDDKDIFIVVALFSSLFISFLTLSWIYYLHTWFILVMIYRQSILNKESLNEA